MTTLAAASLPPRGYRPMYHGAGTSCPGCGHSGWWLGRRDAQCARCGTALPLAPEVAHG